jgi:long-chain acyl-CoA synthetase
MQLLTDFLQPGKVIFRKKEYDPETVTAGIACVARYLEDNLVSNSPFVYLFASNHIKTVLSYFGIIKARRICVIMDPKVGPLELSEMLQDTPPAACIKIDTTTEAFDFDKEIELRKQPWKDDPDQDLSDVCTMIYTAAEDGYAKAAMLTHENMLSNARCIVGAEKLNNTTISCGLSHFNHLYPLQGGVIAPFLVKGGILIEDISDISKTFSIVDTITQIGLTHLYSIPVIYYLFCKVMNGFDKFKSLRSIGSGGYKLTESIYNNFYNKTGKELHEGYGLSEASPVCTWTYNKIKLAAVGIAFPCNSLKIVSESEEFLPEGQKGEICVKGSNIMKGYYNNNTATIKSIKNGWFHTGDLGYIDNEGYIYIIGLKKKMINYGGQKVYPAEVVRLMKKHPNVLDSEVYGADDKLSGKKVEAKIYLKDKSIENQNEFYKWCQNNISNYKIYSKAEFY